MSASEWPEAAFYRITATRGFEALSFAGSVYPAILCEKCEGIPEKICPAHRFLGSGMCFWNIRLGMALSLFCQYVYMICA